MSKFECIKFEYRFLRRQGFGRLRAGFKAAIEALSPLPF